MHNEIHTVKPHLHMNKKRCVGQMAAAITREKQVRRDQETQRLQRFWPLHH